MTGFRNFSIPLWEIFGGNLLMFISIVFYIVWWVVSFRPDVNGKTTSAGIYITITLLAGVVAIASMSLGINALSKAGERFPVIYILVGGVAFYVTLLVVTKIVFQRTVTSELLLITVWAVLEFSVIAVLQSSGRFGMGQAITLVGLIILATAIGIVCYILHYRLDENVRFWNGLIPLIVDAGVVAVFLVFLS